MTIPRFKVIANATATTFWHMVHTGLTPEERTYLTNTPAARRNLDKRILRALGETLLSPDQLSQYFDLELEHPQDDIEQPESGLHKPPEELLP